MDVIDYEIKGAEMQFVEVELDPGEAAVGEAGIEVVDVMAAPFAASLVTLNKAQQN